MRLSHTVRAVVMLLLFAAPLAAAPPLTQPPATGSMYNGNNVAPPTFQAADTPATTIQQNPGQARRAGTDPKGGAAAVGTGTGGTGGGETAGSGGAN